jgi:hypothetical protein
LHHIIRPSPGQVKDFDFLPGWDFVAFLVGGLPLFEGFLGCADRKSTEMDPDGLFCSLD